MKRRNLTVVTRALATRIAFEGRRAVGVHYRRAGRETIARARRLNLSVAYTPSAFDVDEVDDLRLLREALRAAPSRDADETPATLAMLERLAAAASPGATSSAPAMEVAYGE